MLHNRWLHGRIVYPGVVTLRGEQTVFEKLRQLRATERCTPAQLLQSSEHELLRAVRFALTQCPYYASAFAGVDLSGAGALEILQRLPLLDKATVKRDASLLHARPRPRRVTRKTTGGSTGQPVTVLKDRGALAAEMAASWLAYGWFGVKPGDRAIRFWGDPFTLKRRLRYAAADFAMNRLRMSAFAFSDADLKRYWERCLAFGPDYFYGYASMLVGFARYVRENGHDGRRLRLKAIISTSEVLSDAQRSILESTFGCPVQNEYGCGEVGPVAYTCERGRLHVMEQNVFVEILRSDGSATDIGEPGELVLTDLHNRAMPLIRYRVGDFGAWAPPCGCGRPLRALERIYGREYDFVHGLDGRRFHGEFFLYVFEELQSTGYPVEQFQVVQTEPDRLRVDVISNVPLAPDFIVRLRERVEPQMPGMKLDLCSVPTIARASSGKMRLIINEVAATDRRN